MFEDFSRPRRVTAALHDGTILIDVIAINLMEARLMCYLLESPRRDVIVKHAVVESSPVPLPVG